MPKYIVLEGIIGAGKTTVSNLLKQKFKKENIDVLFTREPGGDPVADTIRRLVQGDLFLDSMTDICTSYLYAASRAQTLPTVVGKALSSGKHVVADRSFVTSLSYQGVGLGLGIQKILDINWSIVKDYLPTDIIYLKVPTEISFERLKDDLKERAKDDRWEKESKDFFQKLEKGYEEVSQLELFKDVWHTVDATQSPEDVASAVFRLINLAR